MNESERNSRIIIWTSVIALIVVWALAWVPGSVAVAKTKPKELAKQEVTGNSLDLRNEAFVCNDNGCDLPVRGILIGCDLSGCRPITDIVVSSGTVKRFVKP